jgi:DNA anti-recombination protein RmuC
MPKRPDDRVQWTLKAREFDAEFMNLVRMAAARQGQTITAFVADTLRERAQQIMKGDDGGTPRNTPPARLEDVAGTLAEMITTMAETQEQRLAQIEQDQAARLDAIRRETRRGRWRR